MYDNDMFYLKPLVVFLYKLLNRRKEIVSYVLALLLIFSKNLLAISLDLPFNERFIYESLFTIVPYFYLVVITRDVIIIEFLLLCMFLFMLYKEKLYPVCGLLIGELAYLNPAYLLLFIILFKNKQKGRFSDVFLSVFWFMVM